MQSNGFIMALLHMCLIMFSSLSTSTPLCAPSPSIWVPVTHESSPPFSFHGTYISLPPSPLRSLLPSVTVSGFWSKYRECQWSAQPWRWHLCRPTPTPTVQELSQKRGRNNSKSQRLGRTREEQCLRDLKDPCTSKLTLGTRCTRGTSLEGEGP